MGRYRRSIGGAKIFARNDAAIALASAREGTGRARSFNLQLTIACALAVHVTQSRHLARPPLPNKPSNAPAPFYPSPPFPKCARVAKITCAVALPPRDLLIRSVSAKPPALYTRRSQSAQSCGGVSTALLPPHQFSRDMGLQAAEWTTRRPLDCARLASRAVPTRAPLP
ncbi:uncharacterized protein SCHCODRAFT_01105489 [Schizophyllum commune H4-8]|nr:uncharacterized protein SCHCODRAFT_01105489 [Schizophyllum commune H4-8]KAI5886731.1 hypothetical protein SCHCODRAFT_01105489 [Schizophyllum commune H4-8]